MDPGNAPDGLEEYASVETTTNAQLATVKHVEKATAPPAPQMCLGLHLQRRLQQVQLLPLKCNRCAEGVA